MVTARRVPTPQIPTAKLRGPGGGYGDGSPTEFRDRERCGRALAAAVFAAKRPKNGGRGRATTRTTKSLPRPREVWFYVYVYVIDEYRIISRSSHQTHLHSSSSSCPYFTNHYYIYTLCCILGGGATRAQAHAPAAACRARERCGFTCMCM